jgi:hypothetical protein
MHAERTGYESGDSSGQLDDGASGERIIPRQPRPGHSIMDCLMPATPPQPKNARVIRLFDYEEKSDARPREEAVKAVKEESPTRNREAARAARNQSLLAAAGLL